MKTQLNVSLFFFSLFFISCSVDDDMTSEPLPQGDFDQGTLILNEGGIGSVTYISNDLDRVEHNIFARVNPDDDLGQFAQSIFFDDNNLAYIIANGSNLITVLDRYSFEKIGQIDSGLDVPRYGLVYNGKAYVTNQASFTTGEDDYVAVIDLESLEVVNKINIDKTSEFIFLNENKIYVQNAAFGFGDKVSVINANNNTLETTIKTGEGLQNLIFNANILYALHEKGIDVIELDNFEVTSTKLLPDNLFGAKNLRLSNNFFYFTKGESVYKTPISNGSIDNEPLLTYESTSQFGTMYGFEVNDGLVYLADAGDFASNGFVEIYDANGDFIFKTEVGLAPNGFYFN